MFRKLKKNLVVFLLLQLLFSQVARGESFREQQASQKALSQSFNGVLEGMSSVGKGFWGLTTNTGKLLWQGTREGLTKGARGAKEADRWMQKHLW